MINKGDIVELTKTGQVFKVEDKWLDGRVLLKSLNGDYYGMVEGPKTSVLSPYRLYKKIELNLLVHKRYLTSMTLELERLKSAGGPKDVTAIVYDKVGKGGARILNVQEYYREIDHLNKKVMYHYEYVNKLNLEKEQLDREIEELAEKFNDIEAKVFYYHHIKGIKLKDIARMLNYSYDHIRRINSEVNNYL